MEGLLLAQAIAPLTTLTTPRSQAGWRFPDPHTLVLLLRDPAAELWIDLRPPDPSVRLLRTSSESLERTAPTPFAALLVSRVQGALAAVEQHALDRRFTLHFAAGDGFVPSPPLRLEIELTGRHANAVLCDRDGRILGAQREVGRAVNRYRELRSGLSYQPPPPYSKPDPRALDDQARFEGIRGFTLRDAPRRFDGFGPQLSAAWARLAAVDHADIIAEPQQAAVLSALRELLRDPAAALISDPQPHRAFDPADAAERMRDDRRARWRLGAEQRATSVLAARVLRAERQLHDAEQAVARATKSAELRQQADLLMSASFSGVRGEQRVTLLDFDGEACTLELDPALSFVENAQRRYQSARRLEERAERAAQRLADLRLQLAAAQREAAQLQQLDDTSLRLLIEGEGEGGRRRPERERRPGVAVVGPHGFEVVLGRNARENDAVTFKVGRSLDLWFHAQGVQGAHVVVRSGGREVPDATLRFAAELAAGHAQVGREASVLVDYTQRKHVWKVKGMPPGAVHYTQQKTLVVRPKRVSESLQDAESSG